MNEKEPCNCETKNFDENRRNFFSKLTYIVGGIGAAVVSIPILGSFVAPIIKKYQPEWRRVGILSIFEIGKTTLVTFENSDPQSWGKDISKSAAWLRRNSDVEFESFAINCAHLGCPVRWIPDSELFLCPCHGGVYYKDGSVASGPPPKGLSKYPVRVKDGFVEIKTEPIPITTL